MGQPCETHNCDTDVSWPQTICKRCSDANDRRELEKLRQLTIDLAAENMELKRKLRSQHRSEPE